MVKYQLRLIRTDTNEQLAILEITASQKVYNWIKMVLSNKTFPTDDKYIEIKVEGKEEYEEI